MSGTLRQWTDPAGAVLGVQSYGPFGEPRCRVGTPPWGYTGEWQDPAGMVYLRARWYNPTLGGFHQVDPFPGMPGAPSTQHAYMYAFNDPLGFTDPMGMQGNPIEEAPDWVQWIVGAGMQFTDNAYLGLPGTITESLTGRRWSDVGGPAFHKGREAGSVPSAVYGGYHTVMGSVRLLSASSVIGPTTGLVAALEGPTGGTVTLPGGLVITTEAALALSGALEAGYGVGVIACAAGNRFPRSSGSGPRLGKPPADPTQPPGPDWEWRGSDTPASGRGSWINRKTGESLHPHLDPSGHGPHWDYVDPDRVEWRWFPDGPFEPKKVN